MPTESRAPCLLPQNRKLRHLQGIWLRNLSFAKPKARTADDVDLNTSPAKTDKLREKPALHHARSSESLRPKARRRSTTLSQESPISEQKKLEALYNSLVADAFFSLHCNGEDEPIYVSEKLDRKTNFNFLPFDLNHHGGSVTRSSVFTIRIWARRPIGTKEWSLHQEEEIDLRRLNFLGTLLGQHHPRNGLVVHLQDGIYSFDLPARNSNPKEAPIQLTSSYNALMKLATLENSIQDALLTQEQVTAQINEILEDKAPNEVPLAEQRLELAQKYVTQQSKSVKAATKRRNELRASINARREAIGAGRIAQDRAEKDIVKAREKLVDSKTLLSHTADQTRGQRRRICSDLYDIFPITPSPSGAPLSFQICGLSLPNTSYDMATSRPLDDDRLSAALGLVALLTHHLQFYLSVPLPYPITPFASRSTIRDDISILTDLPRSTSSASVGHSSNSRVAFSIPERAGEEVSSSRPNPAREFPLYLPRGGSTSAHFRFDYGWFLLNKNVEALCASQSLRVVDIRHTLPNLKYLLYVYSAGTEDVPERKRGGVRGLWAGEIKGRGSKVMPPYPASVSAGYDLDSVGDGESSVGGESSRRSSQDSEARGLQSDELRAVPNRRDRNKANVVSFGFEGDDLKVSLRTKGMRENMGD